MTLDPQTNANLAFAEAVALHVARDRHHGFPANTSVLGETYYLVTDCVEIVSSFATQCELPVRIAVAYGPREGAGASAVRGIVLYGEASRRTQVVTADISPGLVTIDGIDLFVDHPDGGENLSREILKHMRRFLEADVLT